MKQKLQEEIVLWFANRQRAAGGKFKSTLLRRRMRQKIVVFVLAALQLSAVFRIGPEAGGPVLFLLLISQETIII